MLLDFKKKIKKLEEIFGIKTQKPNFFEKALTHTSFTKENEISPLESYERLEFLGDAVLKLCISDILYKNFPEYAEGDLTKIRSIIVSDNMLAEVAKQIGLAELILLGKQEEKTGGRERKSIMACAFEAILGAYYLEGKFKEISEFLEKAFDEFIKEVDEHSEKFNAKAVLQEYTQSQNKKLPEYNIVDEVGPEHDKIFVVEVRYMDKVLASGQGKTKREAEQICAYEACVKLGAIKSEK
ncbi:MAG: ribonuclease III [Candidatus Gastranaerophilaceae bacterium]